MAKTRSFVPVSQWQRYKRIINSFVNDDAGRQPFLWLRRIGQPLSYGEDRGIVYDAVQLEGLFHYNYIKTWPTLNARISGELDNTNVVLYITADLLESNGYMNEYGYWDMNWSEDRFILNGHVYKPNGDTQVSQAREESLLFFVILSREDPEETMRLLNSYPADTAEVVTNEGVYLVDVSGKKIKDIMGLPLQVTSSSPDRPIKTSDGVKIN